MLRLDNIKKDYTMKESVVHALKGINLCFRKNEFVSILGPSGCGKTTLLNILGGLDHYTEGDLIIEGRSTKYYDDRDWDIYRNHRIGFVFQSYNLIPQENILENVELALTIAGVSKEEREARAKRALDRVGLTGMYKKKPNQLSGGQCQRVAIARALVNEPEILLADEPTGALDSETSVQIMELIKEISKERLVIMVTHNPELAKQYSTRIISLLDGDVVDDTNPFSIEEEDKERKVEEVNLVRKKEEAKMSWWTAFKLSAKNLIVKVKRTAMIIIAASIGIVGVSAVLSLSGGVTGYIDSMQDEMLSGNPVQVMKSGFDLEKLMALATSSSSGDILQEGTKDGYINVDFIVKQLIDSAKKMGSSMVVNEITPDYYQYVCDMPKEYYQEIYMDYGIDVNNNIYTEDLLEGEEKPKEYSLSFILTVAAEIVRKTQYADYASIISTMNSSLSQGFENGDYIAHQYDIVKGKIPEKEDEIMIVLSKDAKINDLLLTLLGYFSQKQFMNLVHKFMEDGKYDEEMFEEQREIAIDELMSKTFTYFPNNTVLKKNVLPMTSNIRPFFYSYERDSSWQNGLPLKVVGILKPKQNRQYYSLGPGFYYTTAFTKRYLQDNYNSQISKFIRDYVAENKEVEGLPSGSLPTKDPNTGEDILFNYGIYYNFPLTYEGTRYEDNIGFLGTGNSMYEIFASMTGGEKEKIRSSTLLVEAVGGKQYPVGMSFYPNSFDKKYLVTDYLDRWNSKETIEVNGKMLTDEQRDEITYTDNLEVVISMINNVIYIITIALICFTALALLVSTVMIGIITYVSVMERIKEIGTIRALGGRKKDVSNLFYAETLIIGFASGAFGIAFTYLLQLIANISISMNTPIARIATLSPIAALIVILVSMVLTSVAGLVPAKSAAKKDPVTALRSE